jgi:hypothetical protein
MDATLQLITDQFRELKSEIWTITAELRMDMEQQTWHLREGIEATRRELEVQLAAVDSRSRRAGGGSPGAHSTTVKTLKFEVPHPGQCSTDSLRLRQPKTSGHQLRKLLMCKL